MTLRGHILLGILATGAFVGCAKPAAYPEAIAPTAIDLRPRCGVDLEALGVAMPATPGSDVGASRRSFGGLHEESAYGVPIFAESAPRSGLTVLGWGFPLRDLDLPIEASFAPRLGAALLRAGETTSNPGRFRQRVLEIGGTLTSHVEGEWLWLELRYPETQSERAFRVLSEWLKPMAADPTSFETSRRAVALAGLIEDSSPTNLAAHSFRRLHRPPAGALDPDALADDDPEATPDGVRRFLEALIRFEDSVILYAGVEEPNALRASIEATLDRVAPAFVSESTAAAAWPTRASRQEDGSAVDRSPKAVEGADTQHAASEYSIHVVDRPGLAQVEMLIGIPTLAPGTPEFADLELWASLLGGNVGGRLFRDLRERQGLAYIIDAEQSMEGRFVVSTRARPERVTALLRGIEAHLRALVDVPLEECEVRMLQSRSAGETALLAGDAEAWTARSRLDVATLGRPRPSRAALDRRVEASMSDLEAVARERLASAPTIVLVGDAQRLRHDLSVAFPDRDVRIIDPSTELEPR